MRAARRFLSTGFLLLPLGLVLLQAGPAVAGGLGFEPIYLHLKADAPTTTLKLRNGHDQTKRYQLSVFAWSQDATGQMQLAPTQDIVFFPTIFELKPGQQRGVRLGTTTRFAAEEKTYRIFIDELSSSASAPESGKITFQLRNRVGLPIFLDPPTITATAIIDSLALSRSQISFRLRSTGSAHLKLRQVRVRALGDSASIYEHSFPVSYLLVGGELRLSAAVPRSRCQLARTLEVEAQTDRGMVTERIQLSASSTRCSG
jgi:fimbrial chaperone protein